MTFLQNCRLLGEFEFGGPPLTTKAIQMTCTKSPCPTANLFPFKTWRFFNIGGNSEDDSHVFITVLQPQCRSCNPL